MKIGALELKNRFLLAPMLEPNDIAFRLLCKKAGCALAYTGMISSLSKKNFILDDKPAVQLFGNSVQGIKNFIKKNDLRVSLWDFNLGCPSKLSKNLEHGAFMQDCGIIKKIILTMKNSTSKPVTIKIRKSPNALKIAKSVEKYVDAVGIHPRTSLQGYSGQPDYNFALNLKKELSVPVIYSGDADEKNAEKILEDFDFVFIGRAAIGNPNIFSKLSGKETNFNFNDYLKLAKKYDVAFRQIKYQAMNFTKRMKNAKALRREIVRAKSVEEIKTLFGSVENV